MDGAAWEALRGLPASPAPDQGFPPMLLPASWPPVGPPQWGSHLSAAAGALDALAEDERSWLPSRQMQAQPCTEQQRDMMEASSAGTGQPCSKGAAPPAAAGGAAPARRVQPHVSRQQRRLAQRAQREVDQRRIKQLEQQLGGLRQQLQSLTIQNKSLKQRQAALNATLEMQQQIKAAAGRAPPSQGSGSAAASFRSEEEGEELSFLLEGSEEDEGCEGAARGDGGFGSGAAARDGEAAIGRLLDRLSAASGHGCASPRSQAAAGAPDVAAGQHAGAGSAVEGDSSGPGGSSWFFAASLRQHVAWYKQQVDRLAALLRALDAIPPRLGRSLEDYRRQEATSDAVQAVLNDIDDWTIHMAALRPDDYGIVLHHDLQEVLEGGGGGWPGGGGVAPVEDWQPEMVVWQELVEKLALSPQQEQALEAHQSLFEQRAEALAGSKAAVFAAMAHAAARPEGQESELELLEGAEALRASLQQDFSLKAPVMISLRKVLTPMQMARLTVDCWPYYCAMKHLSRAHKQRTQLQRSGSSRP